MQHMTSHTTRERETQLTPLLWALQSQDKHFLLLTGTAASPACGTAGFAQSVHLKRKTDKQTCKEWDNSPVCNTLQALLVGAGPIELLGCKSLLLRGWNLLSQRPKQVHTKVWWHFAGICQAEELCKEKKKKRIKPPPNEQKKMHSFDPTEIYSL